MSDDLVRGLNPIHQTHGISGFGGDPPPPYQITAKNFLFLRAVFDGRAARAAVPEQLEISDENTGFVGMLTSDGGWGLDPYSLCYIAIDIKGLDSADGTPGLFRALNYYSGQPSRLFRRHYNARMEVGYSRQWNEGPIWNGETGRTNPEMRLQMRRVSEDLPPPAAGIHHYLADAPQGGINSFFTTYAAQFCSAELLEYKIFAGAHDLLRSLEPIDLLFASYIPEAPIAISEPRPLESARSSNSGEANRVGLMDIMSRIGLAAALVGQRGQLLFMNELASGMLSLAQVGGPLLAWQRQDQSSLDGELYKLRKSGSRVSSPVALTRPGRQLPVLARALPVSAAMAGEPAFLVLFNDAEASISEHADMMLQILGLTPAEARLAARVGNGQSIKICASHLGVTESTARSTLKIIYDKLGIGKQSQLAGIVARLA